MAIGNVVALVDGSLYTSSVCDHAGWVAKRLDVPVTLVHVICRRESVSLDAVPQHLHAQMLNDLREVDGKRAALMESLGEAIVAEAAQIALKAGAPSVHRRVRHGDLLETIHELEADARVIVVGKRGAAADFAKTHLGSNIERVVRASRVNVLVASRSFTPIKRFLVACDGGPSSRKAIELISRSPVYDHLQPHLLTVVNDPARGQARLEAAQEALNWRDRVVTHIADGDPEKVIADYVDRHAIDLLVMGAYGHSRVRNLLVGSTTSQMMQSCKIPVLIVR